MNTTQYLIDCIDKAVPVSFSKYGDGEYLAALGSNGANCDGDKYTAKLRQGLIESIRYMVDVSDNAFIGQWPDSNIKSFWQDLCDKQINWVSYHTVLPCNEYRQDKIDLLKTIKKSTLNKVYVCNPLLIKAQHLLNINHMVHVPFNNWFDTELYVRVLYDVAKVLNNAKTSIVMTSAGMGAKVLIAALSKQFPNNIYLDFGSALDKICTKKTSRGWERDYNEYMQDLADILPSCWDSAEFDDIYKVAAQTLGRHL